ncbi:MAG: hypothetical protein ACRYFU_23110 [Janthinobacterium lividum]
MRSVHQHEVFSPSRSLRRLLAACAVITLAGCGNTYRPVISAVNPVGPAGQPTKFAVAIATTGATTPGLVNTIDVSGDTIVGTANLGANPFYLVLENSGGTAYTLNGDGTVNSFSNFTNLLASNITQTTLNPNAGPVSILPQANNLYIAEQTQNSVAQLTGTPPALKQILPTGPGTIYTVGYAGAPRVYAISQGATTASPGTVAAIETTTNTISGTITVGRGPVYGVMTADARRAFILNQVDGTVTVINAQTNQPDTFTVNGASTSTINVGTGPLWADFAPTRSEMFVVNSGSATAGGTATGSVTVINIPLCSATSLSSNPNCDVNNPVDAAGFGGVLKTIPVGVNPIMIAVLQDGTLAYVANAGSAAAGIAGSVSVIDLNTNTVIATIPGSLSTAADQTIHGHPNFIAATTGTPSGKVYITALDSTDLTILRTDTNVVSTHLSLQGSGVAVRVTNP